MIVDQNSGQANRLMGRRFGFRTREGRRGGDLSSSGSGTRGLLSFLQEDFLSKLSDLAPDLCITAAYGNILPKNFLSIPRFGE
jgi:hypothetical protein